MTKVNNIGSPCRLFGDGPVRRAARPIRLVHLRLHEAMAQAVNDAGNKVPVVAHKRNRGGWLVTMRADDWFKLLGQRPSGLEARNV